MAAQLLLRGACGQSRLRPHEPLDGGAVLEEAGCSAGIARVSRGGDLHAACIGALGPIRKSLARVNSPENAEGRREPAPLCVGCDPSTYGVSRLSGSRISAPSGRVSPAVTIVRPSVVVVAVVPAGATTSRSS